MKRLLFKVVMVNILIISTLNSCNKDDSLPVPAGGGGGSSDYAITMNLITENWEAKGNGVFVNIFPNIMSLKANQSANIYLNDKEIHERVLFMGGALWASNTQTDVVITYFGNSQTAPRLNIKVVIE
jgi:hypothetical protein